MKKFIIKTAIFSSIIFVIIICVNYFGDAANLFHSGYEKKIAKILSENKNATNIVNYDERILQKEIVEKLKYKPDVVILGSSRTMLIRSKNFNNKLVINSSVSGASIQDIIGIYQIYKDKNRLPKKIVLGIDPWLFNENNGQNRWVSLEKEYCKFTNKALSGKHIKDNKIFQLFSLSYFQKSLENISNVIKGKNKPIATEKTHNKLNTKLPDGSLVYGESYKNATEQEVEKKVKGMLSRDIYSIEKFGKISENIWLEFIKFINDIKKEKIELSLFLAPYHPAVYTKVQEKYPMVNKTEIIIKQLAKNRNITIYGSFNPLKMEIKKEGFFDGMHCKENTIEFIFKYKNRFDEVLE